MGGFTPAFKRSLYHNKCSLVWKQLFHVATAAGSLFHFHRHQETHEYKWHTLCLFMRRVLPSRRKHTFLTRAMFLILRQENDSRGYLTESSSWNGEGQRRDSSQREHRNSTWRKSAGVKMSSCETGGKKSLLYDYVFFFCDGQKFMSTENNDIAIDSFAWNCQTIFRLHGLINTVVLVLLSGPHLGSASWQREYEKKHMELDTFKNRDKIQHWIFASAV